MHIDKSNNGGSFVDLDPVRAEKEHRENYRIQYKEELPNIQTALLSDVVDAVNYKESPSKIIMKMDIEGFECRAILGNNYTFLCNTISLYMVYYLIKNQNICLTYVFEHFLQALNQYLKKQRLWQ